MSVKSGRVWYHGTSIAPLDLRVDVPPKVDEVVVSETDAAARRVLTAFGASDLFDMLGLAS